MIYIFDVIISMLGLKFMNESTTWYKSLLKMIFLFNCVIFSSFAIALYKKSGNVEISWLKILFNGLLAGTIMGIIAWLFVKLVYFIFGD